MEWKLIKTRKNIKKNSKNDIINNNKPFEVVLLKKLIFVWYNVLFNNNIMCIDKKYEFCKYTFIIKLH